MKTQQPTADQVAAVKAFLEAANRQDDEASDRRRRGHEAGITVWHDER